MNYVTHEPRSIQMGCVTEVEIDAIFDPDFFDSMSSLTAEAIASGRATMITS